MNGLLSRIRVKNLNEIIPVHSRNEPGLFCDADKGNRTLTMLPPADFESAASACSATSARLEYNSII